MVGPTIFSLTCKLSTMHRPSFSRMGTHNQKPYARFLSQAENELRCQTPFLWAPMGPLIVDVRLGSQYSRGDLDNYLKGILDAMVRANILQDDSQEYVKGLKIRRARLEPQFSAQVMLSK